MNSKKNIDRLFQEKFKDFDVKPDVKVWQNIQSKLKEEDNDKPVVIIPFWLKLTGIAASFALLLFLGKSVFNTTDNSTKPSIVNTEKTRSNNTNPTEDVSVKNSENKTLDNQSQDIDNLNINKTVVSQKQDANNSSNNNYHTNSSNSKSKKVKSSQAKATSPKTTTTPNNNTPFYNSYKNNTPVIAKNTNSNNQNSPKNSQDKAITVKKDRLNKTPVSEKVFIENTIPKEKTDNNKPSIEDAIADNKNTEDLIEKEEVTNRWNVNANIAPVYYNSFGEGSHISEEFNKNNKSGEINTSYGVKVGYALNDKLRVRSGINRLNLSYDTDNVIVYQNVGTSPTPKALKNIDFNPVNNETMNIVSSNSLTLETTNLGLLKNVGLSQRISYFEVPMEVEYALVNNKFSLNVISGFSTFILEDNALVSEFDGYKTDIGSANNINTISFSANFGVGLNYAFSKAVIFNFEPTFKYQLNAYNNTSGDFNPYIIGVYSGFTYRF